MSLLPPSRRQFLQTSLSLTTLSLVPNALRAQPASATPEIVRRLTALLDDQIRARLGGAVEPERRGPPHRSLGRWFVALSSAYGNPDSVYRQDPRLPPELLRTAQRLAALQTADGTFNAGNIESPPDTAFAITDLAQAYALLRRAPEAGLAEVFSALTAVLQRSGEGLVVGGVHTPNHRWEICAALTRLHAVLPDARYPRRVEEWLSEGIDIDAEGQYAERSPNYSGEVVNPSLLTVALVGNRPALLEAIRRNLDLTLHQTEPNGEVETVASRRQDQSPTYRRPIWLFYVPLRALARIDQNPTFAAAVEWIERDFTSDIVDTLPDLLDLPGLAAPLPPASEVPSSYVRHFPVSHVVRVREGTMSATVFGGTDWHLGLGALSGLSTNPTFFKFRRGAAILDSIRLSPSFFRMGHFRSQGLTVTGPHSWLLRQEAAAAYHHPLPPEARRADGDYPMSFDGRFYSKMAFGERPKQWKRLITEVEVRRVDSGFDLEFRCSGQEGVAVTVELCFRAGGVLTGTEKTSRTGLRLLGPGERVTYQVGNDVIRVGPGLTVGEPSMDAGERYAWHQGSLTIEGERVYLTARSPFQHTLQIR